MVDTATVFPRNVAGEELVSELRALKPVFVRAGVVHMTLYGSRARGDNRPESDVDLIIEVDPERKFSLLDLIGVGHIVEDHFGVRGDVLMRRGLQPFMAEEARGDGVEVF